MCSIDSVMFDFAALSVQEVIEINSPPHGEYPFLQLYCRANSGSSKSMGEYQVSHVGNLRNVKSSLI